MARKQDEYQTRELDYLLGVLDQTEAEALGREARSDLALGARLTKLTRQLGSVRGGLDEAPGGAVRASLLDAVAGGLQSFAPRLRAFLDLDAAQTAEVLRLAERPPEQWADAPASGVRTQPVAAGPRHAEASAFLLRLEPGAEIARHRHRGIEWGFVLGGQLADDEGELKAAGDIVHKVAGSVHRVWNPGTGPTLAVNVVYAGYDWHP